MPSPTSRTWPTSLRVTSGENCSISRWITELISSALNFMRLSFDQSLAKLCESVLHRRVVTVVTDLDDQAPDQIRVGRDARGSACRRPGGEPVAEGLQLALVERDGRANREPGSRRLRRSQIARASRATTAEQAQPLVAIEDAQEPEDQARGPARRRPRSGSRSFSAGRNPGRGQQLGEAGERLQDIVVDLGQLLEQRVDLALLLGRVDQGLGVAVGDAR